ncbi:MAG: hypothetical protein LBP92_13455 [Deltaproteobacteria bacterium]|nr:hypothetical protein [Deltaproteobacteria bacterium]
MSFFLDHGVVAETAAANGITDYNPADYEAPLTEIIISVDDIGVTCQNPARPTWQIGRGKVGVDPERCAGLRP